MKVRDRRKAYVLRRTKTKYAISAGMVARLLKIKLSTAKGYLKEMLNEGTIYRKFVDENDEVFYGITEEEPK